MSRILFSGANLLDGENPAQPGQTVVVEGDQIVAVGSDESIPHRPDDKVFRLEGASIMPGMVQAHWHGSYRGLDFEPPPVGLEKPPGYLMLLAATQAKLALDHGFTSVIGAATGDALDAQLKMAIDDGIVPGPRIMASGRWFITTGDSNDLPEFAFWDIQAQGSQRYCDGVDEFIKGVRLEIREGAEIVKIFMDGGHALLHGSDFVSMTDAELRAAVDATHDRQKLIRCHVTAKRAILKCLDAGVDVFDHADRMDRECIDGFIASGSFVCPSLYLTKAIIATLSEYGDENDPMVIGLRADYDHMLEVLPQASAAGVKLMVGDDWGTAMTPHGDYIKELEVYVNEAGIEPLEVIRWATKNSGECMQMGGGLGTVETGKLADLLVVRGDPSKNISILGDPDNLLAILKDGLFVKQSL
ncbi:MAG: amidohydrolase family protein [Myxococcota bacterium]|nr:amidohydrolase family protein [Myxococcota bacterium]